MGTIWAHPRLSAASPALCSMSCLIVGTKARDPYRVPAAFQGRVICLDCFRVFANVEMYVADVLACALSEQRCGQYAS